MANVQRPASVTYHSSLLDTRVQLCPVDIVRRCQLTNGDISPVSASEARVGVCGCWRVVQQVLDGALGEGWVSLRARRGRGRVALVLDEARTVGGDVTRFVSAGLRARSLAGSRRRWVGRRAGYAALAALGSSVCSVHESEGILVWNALHGLQQLMVVRVENG